MAQDCRQLMAELAPREGRRFADVDQGPILGSSSSALASGKGAATVIRRDLRGFFAAILIVVAGGLVTEVLVRTLNVDRVSMVYLASVLLVAVWYGVYPATFAALLAFFAYNFFLTEPRYTFEFVSADDFLNLSAFLAVALATGILAGRVRDEAQRSIARARTTNALFQASRELSTTADEDELRESLTQRIAEAARGEARIFYRGKVWRASTESRGRAPLREEDDPTGDELESLQGRDDWRTRELRADDMALGHATWRAFRRQGEQPQDDELIQVLVDVGAGAIARARLSLQKSEVETLARTERLRAALLSSISHDFRTPLSSILASVSSLKDFGDSFDPETRRDLLETIEEETERLNRFVRNLLNMTKLEAGALVVETGPIDFLEVAHIVAARVQRGWARHSVEIAPSARIPIGAGDPILLEQALTNVVENAVRYSSLGSTVTLSVEETDGTALVHVEDSGPGVPEEERALIFEKFYRCSATLQPGTGIGLSIARGLIEAMSGSIKARARHDGREGLRVTICLPTWQG